MPLSYTHIRCCSIGGTANPGQMPKFLSHLFILALLRGTASWRVKPCPLEAFILPGFCLQDLSFSKLWRFHAVVVLQMLNAHLLVRVTGGLHPQQAYHMPSPRLILTLSCGWSLQVICLCMMYKRYDRSDPCEAVCSLHLQPTSSQVLRRTKISSELLEHAKML